MEQEEKSPLVLKTKIKQKRLSSLHEITLAHQHTFSLRHIKTPAPHSKYTHHVLNTRAHIKDTHTHTLQHSHNSI